MILQRFTQEKYLPVRIGLSEVYAKNMLAVTSRFSRHIGHQAKLADLTESNVVGYLTAYRKQWSARSTNNQRQILFSLWQEAADLPETLPLLSEPPKPRRIRKLPEERDRPRCWRKRQMRQLVEHLQTLDGEISGIPAADWWLSLVISIHRH